MTPVDDHRPYREEDDLVAAEYVLGVLPADERAAVAGRIEAEPAFARLVEAWEAKLSPMADGFEEVAPPGAVREALQQRLFGQAAPQQPGGLARMWQSVSVWRAATAAAAAALLVLAAVTLMEAPAPDADERFVASLSGEGSEVHYFVVYDARTQDIGLSHVTGARPEGRDFELWVIDDGQPHSLGVIPEGSSVHVAVGEALQAAIDDDAVFAITTEPPGGSPSGAPTGPVVAQGALNPI